MKPLITFSITMLLSIAVIADSGDTIDVNRGGECETDIEVVNSVAVNAGEVRIFDDQSTLYRLQNSGHLWVGESEIVLEAEQQELVAAYTTEVVELVPEIVDLINAALGVAGASLSMAFGEIFGEDSTVAQRSDQLMLKMQDRVGEVAYQDGDTYVLMAHGTDWIEDSFGPEFEQEVEELVAASVGSILGLIGKAITSGEGTFTQRISQFEQRMDNWATHLEADMEAMSQDLEEAGDAMCEEVESVVALEQSMRQSIPQLASFQLFTPEHIRER